MVIQQEKRSIRKFFKENFLVISMALSGLAVAGIFSLWSNSQAPSPRLASLEEKQLLIATLDRLAGLESEGPQVAALRDKLKESSVMVWVDSHSGQWIAAKEGTLAVDVDFFEADPVKQEAELKQFLKLEIKSEDAGGIALERN